MIRLLVPVISRFYGVTIMMYWEDHAPPHFHAKYNEYEIIVEIESGVVEGKVLAAIAPLE